MTYTMLAVKEPKYLAIRQGVHAGRFNIDVGWNHDGKEWGFTASPDRFVGWVANGFGVICVQCLAYDEVSTCEDTYYCDDRSEAHKMATAIRMGLL